MNILHPAKPIHVLACLAILSTAYAQTDPPTRQPGRTPTTPNRTGSADSSSPQTDRILASWVLACNNNEVTLAQAAQTKAQNSDVKQFAETMAKDHGEFGRKLQKFAGSGSEMPGTETGHRRTEGETSQGETGTGRRTSEEAGETGERTGRSQPADAGMQRGADLNHVALIQELSRKQLESAQKMLAEKQGAEYDRCYMGMQVMAHVGVSDMLEVFSKHASPELRTLLQEGQKTVRTHLEKAKDIANKLDGGKGEMKSDRSK